MLDLLLALLAAGRVFFRSGADMALEVLALRQQVAVLKRKHPRPALNRIDRLLWIWLPRVWPRWKDALVIVKPETVIGWHRAGFRLYWRWRSQPHCGRPRVAEKIRTVIRRMAHENADWGAPKIDGELLKLVSSHPNARSPDTFDGFAGGVIRINDGLHFWPIIAKPSLPWTSSLCRH